MNNSAPNSRVMNRTRPAFSDDKKFKKAVRLIFKYGQENKLTEEAVEACKRQGINPDELLNKTVDDFAINI